jgi:hypothetical protein
VLAYAGAALPLLLFYSNIGIGFSESITSEVIAVEVIRTLVGSIGLVAAVPLTTGLAAVVVTGTGVSLPGLPSLTRRAKDDPASEPTRPEPNTTTQEPVEGPAWDRFGPEEREF